ncbi:phosphoribosyltransferase-like protein [Vibrio harveyi]
MKIPEKHEQIYDYAVKVTKKLIRFNYWDRLEISDLDAWLDNFESDEEKYFASGILLSIIYRSNKSINTFGANIIQIKLPNILKKHGIYNIECIESWETDLKIGQTNKLPIRFSAIEGIDGKPGKSGSTIYRAICNKHFHSRLGVLCNEVSTKLKSDDNFKVLVLFDDILGTGTQFRSYIDKFKIDDLGIKILYFPFAAYQESIDSIHEDYKNIIVCPVEVLTESESLFSEDNLAFFNKFHSENTSEEIKEYYLNMCKKKNIKTKDTLGFGNLALTYFFSNSVPNNNIAALWYDSETWTQLVGR